MKQHRRAFFYFVFFVRFSPFCLCWRYSAFIFICATHTGPPPPWQTPPCVQLPTLIPLAARQGETSGWETRTKTLQNKLTYNSCVCVSLSLWTFIELFSVLFFPSLPSFFFLLMRSDWSFTCCACRSLSCALDDVFL